jgi:hypothetical protein
VLSKYTRKFLHVHYHPKHAFKVTSQRVIHANGWGSTTTMSMPKVLEICLTLLKLAQQLRYCWFYKWVHWAWKVWNAKHSKTTTTTQKKKLHIVWIFYPLVLLLPCNPHGVEFHMSIGAYITSAKTIIY